MSKRLQKRLGVTLPEPEPATADDYVERSPRRPAGDASIAGAVAAGAASAAATAISGTPKPKIMRKSGIRPPGAARPVARIVAPDSIQRRSAQRVQVTEAPEPQVVPTRSPVRFTRHPDAPPTPPLFTLGAPTRGQIYEQEQFDIPATEKFGYSKAKLLQKKCNRNYAIHLASITHRPIF